MEVSQPVRYAVLALCALLAVGLGWQLYKRYQSEQRATAAARTDPSATAATNIARTTVGQTEKPKPQIKVHVAGAVNNPGVYSLGFGARVEEAVAMAGGALADGVPGVLNLAEPLSDGRKIYVCSKAEVSSGNCPSQSAGIGGSGAKVNVNTATAADLAKVPGLDPTLAQALVSYRTKNGPFKKSLDLTKVSGITTTIQRKISPYITLE